MSDGLIRGFLVIIYATALVAIFPYFRTHIPLLADITSPYATISPLYVDLDTAYNQQNPMQDTALMKDTLMTIPVDTIQIDYTVIDKPKDTVDHTATEGLSSFLQALSDLEGDPKKKVRILWFGDSMIEGDLITQDVRNKLQHRFGGAGVGYVPITSVVSRFRYSIRHEFSDNWLSYNLVRKGKPNFPMNWNGMYFTVSPDTLDSLPGYTHTSVQYSGGLFYSRLKMLNRPTLIYGKRIVNDSIYPDVENSAVFQNDTFLLAGKKEVNFLEFSDSSFSSVDLDFNMKPDQPLFGMNFSVEGGIELNNLASRGNSGMLLSRIDASVLKGMCGEEAPALIVLQYGVNASAPGMTEYSWYRRAMVRVVNYLQQTFPETSILIVSMPDRNIQKNGIMQTDSSVYAMNLALEQVATSTGTAYFDLFAKMGGTNSMAKWVDTDPPLANKDYTHFNPHGSKKVADFFFDFFMAEYNDFLMQQTTQ